MDSFLDNSQDQDYFLYESDVPVDEDCDSQGFTIEDLGSELDRDSEDPTIDEFDWDEAVPGNIGTPQSMVSSSQTSSSASARSTLSPCSTKSRRVRVPSNPDSLTQPSIEQALGADCSCRRRPNGVKCMTCFDIGDIFRLRYARHKMSFAESAQIKRCDLEQAFSSGAETCRIMVEGKSICLQAYCMLYNLNWSSARRSWAQLADGQRRGAVGRPTGSSGGVMSSAKGLQAYAWLKSWIEVAADEDPVGLKYKYIVNYILPSELYGEYAAELTANRICQSELPLSRRAFTRIWSLFKIEEKLRVRRKANTTTKCEGLSLFVFILSRCIPCPYHSLPPYIYLHPLPQFPPPAHPGLIHPGLP